ncbi:MAG TPA: galactonate dehydratase [Actinopolymorphaceae bacterium]
MRRIAAVTPFAVPPRWLFVRVDVDDGSRGWGEAIVPKRRRAVTGAIQDLAENIIGSDADRVEELWQRMRRGGFFRDGPVLATATAAIEHALWDAKARTLGVPVHQMLGGRVREYVPVYAWIAGDRPESVVADARIRWEQGFCAVKMNATAECDYLGTSALIDDVVARVGALRDEFGAHLSIALDFHGRVPRSMARTLLRELAAFRLLWVEEPLPPGHEEFFPELASEGVRLATGERLLSRWDFREVLRDGAISVLQPDVSLTGLFELEKICRMAEAYDLAVVPHCPNGPVSLAASLQVAATCVNVPLHEQSLGLHYHAGYAGLERAELIDYLVDPVPLSPESGRLPVASGPGLGIDIDARVVEERSGEWHLPDPDWRLPDGRIAEW